MIVHQTLQKNPRCKPQILQAGSLTLPLQTNRWIDVRICIRICICIQNLHKTGKIACTNAKLHVPLLWKWSFRAPLLVFSFTMTFSLHFILFKPVLFVYHLYFVALCVLLFVVSCIFCILYPVSCVLLGMVKSGF